MPTTTKHNLATLGIIESWRHTAESEVEDIGCWRDADSDTVEAYWLGYTTIPPSGPAKMPGDFYTQTSFLVGEITSNYPKLDPTPLQEIYEIVSAWHEDRSASRLPTQVGVIVALDRSMMTLQAVDRCVLQRSDTQTTERPSHTGEPLTNLQDKVYEQIRRSHKPVSGKELCELVPGLSQSTLTKDIIPVLKKRCSVKNKRGAGYYIQSPASALH